MDTTPIYELRERLRAAAIAGTSLLSEDFRLRRTFETFKPLETASPVFAKVGQLTEELLSPDCSNMQGALLDTLSLVDAVVCTLGTVDVKGEVEQPDMINAGENTYSVIVNAPCSALKELLEALTTSGSGHYGYVCDTRENHPELFRDYRVKYALVQALGASYAELADNVEQWMKEDNDRTFLPLLYKDFDPKGKKEMVRRVEVIEALAGAGANDFYIRMLEEAQKEIRQALIFALRHEQENVPLLLDMVKTEKGKNKEAVLMALANIDDERASTYLKKTAEKQPETVLKYLINATSTWSAELVETICDKVLERFDQAGDIAALDKEKLNEAAIPYDLMLAMFGKGGQAIRRCYLKILKRKDRIDCFLDIWRKTNPYAWQCNIENNGFWFRSKQEPVHIEKGLDKILQQSLVVNPDDVLRALAMELYQKSSDNNFLSAVVTAKLIEDEDCVEWLDKQIATARYPSRCMEMVVDAAAYIKWNETQNEYSMHGRTIRMSHARKLMEWFKKHATAMSDRLLMQWLPINDKEMCHEMGEYFYNKALKNVSNDRSYLGYMKRCGWTDCKGLGVQYVKTHQKEISSWGTCYYLHDLPGDSAAIEEEYKTICSMIDTGKIKVDAKEYETFKQRMLDYL